MRMLVVFEKGSLLRHIGHLDLMRTMQRALRRSGLNVAYSQGFNPHMIANFASALSVGVSGKREIMDIALAGVVPADIFLERFNPSLPSALHAIEARLIEDNHPAPMALLHAASYESVIEGLDGETLAAALPAFLKKVSIPAIRKTKSGDKPCDIRPMIYALAAGKAGEAHIFTTTLALREEATCKPDLLFTALSGECGIACPRFTLVRTGLWGRGSDGALVALESM